jgi:hypothetical protein
LNNSMNCTVFEILFNLIINISTLSCASHCDWSRNHGLSMVTSVLEYHDILYTKILYTVHNKVYTYEVCKETKLQGNITSNFLL